MHNTKIIVPKLEIRIKLNISINRILIITSLSARCNKLCSLNYYFIYNVKFSPLPPIQSTSITYATYKPNNNSTFSV